MLGLELREDGRPNESNICTRDKTRQAPAELPANTIEEGATGAWNAPGVEKSGSDTPVECRAVRPGMGSVALAYSE